MSQRRDAGAKWFEQRVAEWRSAGDRLRGLEHGKSAPTATVLEAVRAYPEIARDLAIARRAAPNGALTKYLEGLYRELHRSLFRPPAAFWRGLLRLFTHDAAAATRELRAQITTVTTLFAVSLGAGAWLLHTYPELITLLASEQAIEGVQRGELWTDSMLSVFPSSVVSVQIFTNNIVVCLFAVCLGVLYGLGTFYLVAMNGFNVGAMFAFTAQYGVGMRLFQFTAAHGFVELSVIVIASAVGMSLGEALARPGELTRAAAFQHAVARGFRLMVVCLTFLVGAGVLEGFVSPNPRFPLAARLAIGLAYFALFMLVLSGALGRFAHARAARG